MSFESNEELESANLTFDEILLKRDEINENAVNQNATNESATDERAINEGAANKIEAQKPANRVYELNWTALQKIIDNLNRYTRLLGGEEADTEPAKLMLANTTLYEALLKLPLKSNTDASISSHPTRIVLDLDFKMRLNIVNLLFANQTLMNDAEPVSEEIKRKIIEHNNRTIADLMKLSMSVATGPSDDELVLDGKHEF